ncbi:MAG: flagellar hook-length control protein FliK, partial [Ruminiclostridium sp.]|nr:flagellar hook-length control protein FliK [Ruminiclostridium sp.]
VISEAVEAVVREVAGTGETPSPEKAAEMLGDALKKAVGKAEADKDGEITGTAEEILNAVIDAVAAYSAGASEETQTGIAEEEAGTVPETTVHVISPDSSFLMTEKHSEAAMITSGMEREPADDDELMSFDDEFARMFERSVVERFTGKTDFTDMVFTDRESLIENVLSRLGDDTGIGGEPIADMQAVKDTAEMLGELISKAKNELGLTDVRLEHIVGENDAAAPLIADQPIKLSQSMNHRDRTDELDRILSGNRTDAREEPGAAKTETYDAVHMQGNVQSSGMEPGRPAAAEEFSDESVSVRPVEVQAAEQIIERIRNMQEDRTEFTMVLNPESLGRITVKLVMNGERTAVEITAENPDTRALLASRSENLQNMLHDNGVDLERYQVVTENEQSRFERQSYEGSSRNPYSRSDENEEKKDDDDDGGNFYDLIGNL